MIQEKRMIQEKSLIIRYSMLCDDRSKDPIDAKRIAEFVCSLLSLKIYLLPYVNHHLVIYTLNPYLARLQDILKILDISNYSFILLDDEEDIVFSESIKNCSPVDRICIRRMLADFRELPSNTFRLLMGADCYFFQIPTEVIAYTWNPNPKHKVLYMVDNFTFQGRLYRLRFYKAEILRGLLGDFYCLAPGVVLERESIINCLKLIDAWPPYSRWVPDLPARMKKTVHACEQQAAAILLGQFPGKALPSSRYNHSAPKINCTLLHSHSPWGNISLKEMPQELASLVQDVWKDLGYNNLFEEIEKLKTDKVRFIKRRVRRLAWKLADEVLGER